MRKEFKMVAGWVMSVLGIQNFAKDSEGRLHLTAEQMDTLKEKYGEQFVTTFAADLAKCEDAAEPLTVQERLELDALRQRESELNARNADLKKSVSDMQATIARLEAQPGNGQGHQVTVSAFEAAAKKAGVDLSLKHNKFICDFMQGKVQAAYSGNSTIDTQELKQEFGKYVDQNRQEILRGLFGQTESTQFMSTVITDKTEVRATQASVIGTVLQQFVPQWTPSGAAKFTPLTIRNYKCKLNVSIIPSDIMEDILGYLYDEQATTLQSMPVVRYILQQLIFPKLDEDREQALATGRFTELQPNQSGQYSASTPQATMDGYLTQLCDKYLDDAEAEEGDTLSGVRWLQQGVQISPAQKNVRTVIDAAVKQVADNYPLYAKKRMKVHIDPVLADAYRREYLEEYKWLKNQDGTHKNDIDFSNFEFAELEGMRGTGCFFITPKENFKHLMSHNPQNVTLRFQEQDYQVKVFGEWWEGTGFWMAEAIFAYISPEYVGEEPASTTGGGSTETGGGTTGGGSTESGSGESGSGSEQAAEPTYTYNAVDATAEGYSEKNPVTEGWYERSGTEGNYTYALSDDTTVQENVTYYTRSASE